MVEEETSQLTKMGRKIAEKLFLPGKKYEGDTYLNLFSIIEDDPNYNNYFPLVFTFIYNMFNRLNSTKICKGIESILFLNTYFIGKYKEGQKIVDLESIDQLEPNNSDNVNVDQQELDFSSDNYNTNKLNRLCSKYNIIEINSSEIKLGKKNLT